VPLQGQGCVTVAPGFEEACGWHGTSPLVPLPAVGWRRAWAAGRDVLGPRGSLGPVAHLTTPPQPKPPPPAARRPARATQGGNFRHGHYPPKRRWLDCAGMWAIHREGKRRAQAVSATRGRRGSLPYTTIARGARTARTIAPAGGGCLGPRLSNRSCRDAPALGHRKHGAGSYPLSTHRHPCDSPPPSGSHATAPQ
jgi:hypothetical protein